MRFLQECDSNMLITTEMKKGHIGELAELLNTLLKERKKERADYQKKEQMIADIYTNLSNDIRTPLTSLDGYFQLLEETQEENDRKRYIQIIQERIESLKEMLEELFTYTKLQNGTYELKLEPQNVGQILKETVFSYYDDWAEQEISPQFEITEEPVWIRGNKQALRRTIQNIIKNGLDHGNKEIRIQLSRNEKQMELVFQNKIEPVFFYFCCNLPVHFFHKSLCDGEPQPGRAFASGFICLIKSFKYSADINLFSWFYFILEDEFHLLFISA